MATIFLHCIMLTSLLCGNHAADGGLSWIHTWPCDLNVPSSVRIDQHDDAYFALNQAGSSQVRKLDPGGGLLWEYTISSTSDVMVHDLAVDSSGDVYAVGDFHCGISFKSKTETVSRSAKRAFDIFLCKITSNGELDWARTWSGSDSSAIADFVLVRRYAVAVDDCGNIFITGPTPDRDLSFETGLVSCGSAPSAFLWRLDKKGELVWARTWNHVLACAIATCDAGAVFLTGSLCGSFDAATCEGDIKLKPKGICDAFACKLNYAGDPVWAKSWGGSKNATGIAITVDEQGNFYIAGNFNGTVDFGPELGIYTADEPDDCFLVKLTALGAFCWVETWSGPNVGSLDIPQGIATDAFGNVYVAGTYFCVQDYDLVEGYQPMAIMAFVSSYDSSGKKTWEQTFGNIESSKNHPGYAEGQDVAFDKKGNLFVAGAFLGVVDLGFGDAIDHWLAVDHWDLFLSKRLLPPGDLSSSY